MVHAPRCSTRRSRPSHHDHPGSDLEGRTRRTYAGRSYRPVPEFFISCFLGSEVVWSGEWASQPGRTPGNRNPSGGRTGGESAGLARGMPNLSSTGLEGERSWSRAGRSAEDFDLDDEMLRAKGRFLIASEEPPGPRRPASQALTSTGVVVLLRPCRAGDRAMRRRCPKDERHPSGCLPRRAQRP
jgi:hypothetical protein